MSGVAPTAQEHTFRNQEPPHTHARLGSDTQTSPWILTWKLEEGVPDAGPAAVLEGVALHLVRRRGGAEDEALGEAVPGEVGVPAVGQERQGEQDERAEELHSGEGSGEW